MKNQYNEHMTSRISTESLLSSAMVAYHLKKDYESGDQVEILANFLYQEDNSYFAEKYLKQEYFDGDEQPVSYWGTTYVQDRRDEEVSFLRKLFREKIIQDFVISYGKEEDPVGLGIKTKQPKKYAFTITDKYLSMLDAYMMLADARLVRESSEQADSPIETQDTDNSQKQVEKFTAPAIRQVVVHDFQPEHYDKRKGILYLSPTDKVIVAKRGSAKKVNGLKYDQCHLLACLFKTVNTLNKGVKISMVLGVSEPKITNSDIKKVRNLLQEINEKVTAVGGPKKLVRLQSQKVFIDSSYLS